MEQRRPLLLDADEKPQIPQQHSFPKITKQNAHANFQLSFNLPRELSPATSPPVSPRTSPPGLNDSSSLNQLPNPLNYDQVLPPNPTPQTRRLGVYTSTSPPRSPRSQNPSSSPPISPRTRIPNTVSREETIDTSSYDWSCVLDQASELQPIPESTSLSPRPVISPRISPKPVQAHRQPSPIQQLQLEQLPSISLPQIPVQPRFPSPPKPTRPVDQLPPFRATTPIPTPTPQAVPVPETFFEKIRNVDNIMIEPTSPRTIESPGTSPHTSPKGQRVQARSPPKWHPSEIPPMELPPSPEGVSSPQLSPRKILLSPTERRQFIKSQETRRDLGVPRVDSEPAISSALKREPGDVKRENRTLLRTDSDPTNNSSIAFIEKAPPVPQRDPLLLARRKEREHPKPNPFSVLDSEPSTIEQMCSLTSAEVDEHKKQFGQSDEGKGKALVAKSASSGKRKKVDIILTWKGISKLELFSYNRIGDILLKRIISPQSREFKKFQMFFNSLGAESLVIEELSVIYNPDLISNFNIASRTLYKRHQETPKLFCKKDWASGKSFKEREWVAQCYEKRVAEYPWNLPDSTDLPILPVWHGTDCGTADKICQTGFATTSALDAGYYGQGIYFSSFPMYTLPYFCTKKDPCLLLCFAIPGNIYPVIESRQKLCGSALKTGYQSHYVLTDKIGDVAVTGSETYYDELVVTQESEVIPAYMLRIGKSNLSKLGQEWARNFLKTGVPKQKLNPGTDDEEP